MAITYCRRLLSDLELFVIRNVTMKFHALKSLYYIQSTVHLLPIRLCVRPQHGIGVPSAVLMPGPLGAVVEEKGITE